MDRQAFDAMAKVEERHWWFRGRRAIIAEVLRSFALPPGATILEAGCGSGGNLAMLAKFGRVAAFEIDAEALALSRARQAAEVEYGAFPDQVPFAGRTFDVVGLFDVLEHLEQPVAALASLRPRLARGGRLLLTVPAYQWLWSGHDVVHQHYRRYSAPLLRAHIGEAGFTVRYVSHFNTALFPVAVAGRLAGRLLTPKGALPSALLPIPAGNDLLTGLFASERHLLPAISLPFGLSLMAIATAD